MSVESLRYEHHELRSSKSVRLIRVIPGNDDSPIRLELMETPLDDKPDYVALSYVWGNDSLQHKVYINNTTFLVGQSLFHALKRFRRLTTTRVRDRYGEENSRLGPGCLWADAICINQKDLEERAQQVSLMRRIYESATLVWVYLGEDSRSHQLAEIFEPLRHFAMAVIKQKPEPPIQSKIDEECFLKYGLPRHDDPQQRILIDLLAHPWFTRVWTFPESLVAKKCILSRGDFVIDQQVFFMITMALHENNYARLIDREVKPHISPVTAALSRCVSVYTRQGALSSPFIAQTWSPSPLIELLTSTCTLKASKPQDCVFAMLGISREAEEEGLRPNYAEPIDQTHLRVARYMIDHGHGFRLLVNAIRICDTPACPSWVPRWGIEFDNGYRVLGPTGKFSAAAHSVQEFRLHENGSSLEAKGVIWDVITSVGSSQYLIRRRENRIPPLNVENVLACLSEALEMLRGIKDSPYKHESQGEVLLRLSTTDLRNGTSTRAPKEYSIGLGSVIVGSEYYLHQQSLQKKPPEPKFAKSVSTLIGLWPTPHPFLGTAEVLRWRDEFMGFAGHCLRTSLRCITKRGHIGSIASNARIGDKVAILAGCKTPFLLREISRDKYCLISDCYIHGIMDGEAWDETCVEDIEII